MAVDQEPIPSLTAEDDMALGQQTVSVVTVVLNGADVIESTINSVLDQSHSDLEFIVIDGGSVDGTTEIVSRYRDSLSEFISEKDNGIYDAMNKGLALASGKIVAFLNAGDLYFPDTVERVVEKYKETGANFVFGSAEIVDETGGITCVSLPADLNAFSRGKVQGMPFCHQALFVEKDVFDALGGFDTRYRIAADMDFAMRMLASGKVGAQVTSPLVRYRRGGVSESGDHGSSEKMLIAISYGRPVLLAKLDWFVAKTKRRVVAVLPRPVLKWLRRLKRSRYRDSLQ